MNILLKTRVAAALCYSCFPGLGTDGAPPDSEESNVRFIVLHRKSKIKQHYRRWHSPSATSSPVWHSKWRGKRGGEQEIKRKKIKNAKYRECKQSTYSENKTFSPWRLIFENTINLHLKPLPQDNNSLSKGLSLPDCCQHKKIVLMYF